MEKIDPEKTARQVLDACADCDVCRFLMDTSCLFSPELYRLYDREMEGRKPIASDIRELNPERLVTDCLSCRMQFDQLLPVAVVHPVEILRESYSSDF
jgi:hypothetical protein